jgi:hypothetical protein
MVRIAGQQETALKRVDHAPGVAMDCTHLTLLLLACSNNFQDMRVEIPQRANSGSNSASVRNPMQG